MHTAVKKFFTMLNGTLRLKLTFHFIVIVVNYCHAEFMTDANEINLEMVKDDESVQSSYQYDSAQFNLTPKIVLKSPVNKTVSQFSMDNSTRGANVGVTQTAESDNETMDELSVVGLFSFVVGIVTVSGWVCTCDM